MIRGRETLTVLRKTQTGVDLYNNPVVTEVQIAVPGCLVEIGSTAITQELFRDVAKIECVVYAPSGTVFEGDDSFILRGMKYSLSEEPKVWTPMEDSILEPRVIIGLVRYNG